MFGIPGTPSIPGDPIEAGVNLFKGGGGGGGLRPASAPPAADNSDAMLVSSENNRTVAEGQIMTQEFSMQQTAMDRELKRTADLELSLESFDTKLQTGLLEFKQSMTEEENRHVEIIASDALKFGQLTATSTDSSSDIPPPSP